MKWGSGCWCYLDKVFSYSPQSSDYLHYFVVAGWVKCIFQSLQKELLKGNLCTYIGGKSVCVHVCLATQIYSQSHLKCVRKFFSKLIHVQSWSHNTVWTIYITTNLKAHCNVYVLWWSRGILGFTCAFRNLQGKFSTVIATFNFQPQFNFSTAIHYFGFQHAITIFNV